MTQLKQASLLLQARRDALTEEKARLTAELSRLDVRVMLLAKVGELYRHLLDSLVLHQAQGMSQIATEGLKAVLHDQDLAVVPDMGQRAGRVTLQFLLQQGGEGGPKGLPQSSFGGGPTSLTSLILRVLLLLRTGRAKFLILDETLGPLSDQYIEPAGKFLAQLSRSTGVPILLVTHKSQFLEEATQRLLATEGAGPQLVLKRV